MGSCPDTDSDPNLLDKPNRAGLFFQVVGLSRENENN